MKYPEHLLDLIGPNKKFSGHVRKHKNGYLYIVINDYKRDETGQCLLDEAGKKVRDPEWIPTGLKIRGNITKAEAMIPDIVDGYTEKFMRRYANSIGSVAINADMPFVDYMYYWLSVKKMNIRKTTYASYKGCIDNQIAPYFRALGIKLIEVDVAHIQHFYAIQSKRGVKNNTTVKYHACLYSAFKMAVKTRILSFNPMELVERPKPETYIANDYNEEEANAVIACSKDTKLELPILFATFYGLRRSEVVGLRWDCFDFTENTFTIRHTVTSTYVDNQTQIIEEDRTKTNSSTRTLPLVAPVKQRLLEIKQRQMKYRKLCGRSYITDYLPYICVNEIGDRIKPDYITQEFPKFLEKQNMKIIRFHDLRHTCATLLLRNGVSMKDIMEWLGHSDIQTTSRYAHADMRNKKASANTMLDVMNL